MGIVFSMTAYTTPVAVSTPSMRVCLYALEPCCHPCHVKVQSFEHVHHLNTFLIEDRNLLHPLQT